MILKIENLTIISFIGLYAFYFHATNSGSVYFPITTSHVLPRLMFTDLTHEFYPGVKQ